MSVKRPIGIGMVGAGMVGQIAHLANFAQVAGARVVAIAELRPELGAEAAQHYGVAKLYPSHRELLNDADVDAVVVVTRRPATGPIVLDALRAKRHVLSEKPMSHSVAQAQILVDAARAAGVRYSVGFMKRHDPGVVLAKRTIDELRRSEDMGRIATVRAWCLGGNFNRHAGAHAMTAEPRPDGLELWPIAPDWLEPALHQDYAWFTNVFIHDVNLLRYLLGDEVRVRYADLRDRDARIAHLDFADFPAVLEMAELPIEEWREGVEVTFERGTLRLDLNAPLDPTPARVTLAYADGRREILTPPDGWAFRRQAEAFVAEIASGAAALASGEDSVADLHLIEDIWRRHLAEKGGVS